MFCFFPICCYDVFTLAALWLCFCRLRGFVGFVADFLCPARGGGCLGLPVLGVPVWRGVGCAWCCVALRGLVLLGWGVGLPLVFVLVGGVWARLGGVDNISCALGGGGSWDGVGFHWPA